MTDPLDSMLTEGRRWGTGRKLKRTLYARERGDGVPAAGDILIGMVDDPRAAEHICDLHNRWLQRIQQGMVK